MRKGILKKIIIAISLMLLGALVLLVVSYTYVEYVSRGKTYASTFRIPKNTVGLLLGTSPVSSYTKKANPYYYYRIDAAIRLYKSGKIDRILISGDNSTKSYSEPDMMKEDLMKRGIPSTHIYLDFAGFRTLDSVLRAKKVFKLNRFTVISQEFHNERAICLAKCYDIQAIGYNAKDISKRKGLFVQIREIFARVKLVLDIMVNEQPRFLGDTIEIS